MSRRPWHEAIPGGLPVGARPRVVKLMVDYGCELPLWPAAWRALALSPALLDALADWQDAFERGFDPMRGWSQPAANEAWAADAVVLADRLRHELGPDTVLEVDLWPIEDAS